jgi:hypothetical protein
MLGRLVLIFGGCNFNTCSPSYSSCSGVITLSLHVLINLEISSISTVGNRFIKGTDIILLVTFFGFLSYLSTKIQYIVRQ